VRDNLIQLVAEQGDSSASLLYRFLRLDESIVRYLLSEPSLDSRLRHVGALLDPAVTVEWGMDDDDRRPLENLVADARAVGRGLVLYFSGPSSSAKRETAHVLAAHVDAPLLGIDVRSAVGGDADTGLILDVAVREALLRDAVLHVEPIDPLLAPELKTTWRRLTNRLATHPGITVLAGTRPALPAADAPHGVVHVRFPIPAYDVRRRLWHDRLTVAGMSVEAEQLDQLAGRFRLTPDQIGDAVDAARNRAHIRTGDPRGPSLADLFEAARGRSEAALEGLARKIEPIHDWEQIVLPDDATAQLREMCAQIVHRHRVLDEWGFGRTLSLGKGVSALFAGPSGTGKTMAAEIIARDLGLDLYKIELSGVVSKYIGETEKNLERIFTAAENANAILFFDEADALFGKRSEVRDSHDRYANLEIAYLLQRMDQYDGVAILATNLRQNMDDAFVRRLQFVVEFPFPDEGHRARIWPLLFPHEAECDPQIDFDALAQSFRITGGSIKNIVLGGAFLAANDAAPIAMRHLLHATRREYLKLGRVLTDAELAPFADQVTS
jgi:hypothetical protein